MSPSRRKRVGADRRLPDHVVLLAFFVRRVSAFWAGLWRWYFHEDPREHPRITSELAALPKADPAGQIGSGPVLWRRLVPRVAPLMIIYFC
jgi:hypothetical protein